MMPSDLKVISPSHVFASLASQNKWNYIVCAKCPKVNMYCDIFPLWLCRAALLFSVKDESPDNIGCFYLLSLSPSTGGCQTCFPIRCQNVQVIIFSALNTITFVFVCLTENH